MPNRSSSCRFFLSFLLIFFDFFLDPPRVEDEVIDVVPACSDDSTFWEPAVAVALHVAGSELHQCLSYSPLALSIIWPGVCMDILWGNDSEGHGQA